ncbi:MAG: acyl-CoA thioesterase [Burkholderiaceae bacterium]|nr:acyl-CoA thioesterase [Burkholderiaceae bacterium]
MSEKKLVHVSMIPVRWGDMDAYEHVNNTIYFRYAEQCRCEWLEQIGMKLGIGQAEAPVIVNASCSFLIPVTYPSTVEVRMYAGSLGRSSVVTHYEMRVVGDDRLYAEGAAKVVWIDVATGKSRPIPEALRSRIGLA